MAEIKEKWERANSKQFEVGAYYWCRTERAEFRAYYDGKLIPVGVLDENKLMTVKTVCNSAPTFSAKADQDRVVKEWQY